MNGKCLSPDKMDEKPCKIMWDVSWEELMTVELAKAGCAVPSLVILHLKNFRRSDVFVRVIKCSVGDESEGQEPQAVKICSTVRKMWKAYQSHMKSLTLKVSVVHGFRFFGRGTYVIHVRFLMCRFLQARDMCALLGVKLIKGTHIARTRSWSSQESYRHQVRHLVAGDLLHTVSTL